MTISAKPWLQLQAEYTTARRNRPSENALDARNRLGAAMRHTPDDHELLNRLRAELAEFAAERRAVAS